MNITKIYLVENCYGDPNKVYIGKTKTTREKDHKKTYGDQITYTYIDEINSLNREDWEPLESYWIEQFRQWGFEIQNKNNGGNGPEYQSIITKEKISRSLQGIKWNINRNQKISNSNKIHYIPGSDRNQKISSALSGRKYSFETILKLSKPKPHGFGEKIKSEERNKKIGKANSKPIIQIKDDYIINQYESTTQASHITGVKIGNINSCLKQKSKTAGGFIWKYKGDILNLEQHKGSLNKKNGNKGN